MRKMDNDLMNDTDMLHIKIKNEQFDTNQLVALSNVVFSNNTIIVQVMWWILSKTAVFIL